jgi:hypothetical protein
MRCGIRAVQAAGRRVTRSLPLCFGETICPMASAHATLARRARRPLSPHTDSHQCSTRPPTQEGRSHGVGSAALLCDLRVRGLINVDGRKKQGCLSHHSIRDNPPLLDGEYGEH